MAAFGERNFGTPLGALTPSGFFGPDGSGFYDYSGFSSREGMLGFSGFSGFESIGFSTISGFSSFCFEDGIEFLPWTPTLIFPRTYALLDGLVEVRWEPARPEDACSDDVTYTIQFTRNFSRDSGWRTIADNIPAGTRSHAFDASEIPFTEDGGIRIRARDSKNLTSRWSKNIEAFTIKNHPPAPVSLLAPLGKETFDNAIVAIWREADVKDLDGHEVTYRVEATSTFSKGRGWVTVPGAESLTEGTTSFTVNTFDFPEGDDFGLRVTASDELGAESMPQQVGGIKIRHSGNFIIDTLPPTGSITINDGDVLAKDTRVKLSLFAEDRTTGVKDVRFRNEDEECFSDWDTFTAEKFWDLTSGDGVKRVFVQYRDFADNVSEVCDCEIVSRVLCDDGNATDIQTFGDKLFASFDKDGNLVEFRVLAETAAQLDEPELTSLAKLENLLYIAAFDAQSGRTAIYQYDGTPSQVATISGAKALSMASYNKKVYIGLDDGRIMELSGTSLSASNSVGGPVSRLRSDGSVLFANADGVDEYFAFDGASWKTNTI